MAEPSIRRAKLVALPQTGLWRVTDWHQPFDPPPPPPAIGTADADEDNAGRWDAPDESFRILYCSTVPEGAIGEKIAPFAQNPEAVAQIEAFLDDDPDPGFDDDVLAVGLTAGDIAGLNATLSWAPASPGALAVDVAHPRTLRAFGLRVLAATRRWGVSAVDRLLALTETRNVTRTYAGILHRAASEGHDAPVWAQGLRFKSRLGPAWECWALWDPVAVEAGRIHSEALTIDDVHLQNAAAQLGVVLYGRLN